eukprot:8807861-Pyramimonas_sp.AAC.1
MASRKPPQVQRSSAICFIAFHGETIAMILHGMCEIFDEFTDLNVGATVNTMQPISGNAPEGKQGPRLADQRRYCLTTKGRAGHVLAIDPIRAE